MRWYVYELVDPRTGKPFYIGKGCGRRMRCHLGKQAAPMVKAQVNLIRSAGHEPIAREIAYFYEEEDALAFETDKISATKGLVNVKNNAAKPRIYTLIGTLIDVVHVYAEIRRGAKHIDRHSVRVLIDRLKMFRAKAIGLPHEATYLMLIDQVLSLTPEMSN